MFGDIEMIELLDQVGQVGVVDFKVWQLIRMFWFDVVGQGYLEGMQCDWGLEKDSLVVIIFLGFYQIKKGFLEVYVGGFGRFYEIQGILWILLDLQELARF